MHHLALFDLAGLPKPVDDRLFVIDFPVFIGIVALVLVIVIVAIILIVRALRKKK